MGKFKLSAGRPSSTNKEIALFQLSSNSSSKPQTKITVSIDKDIYKELKTIALEKEQTIKDIINHLITDFINKK